MSKSQLFDASSDSEIDINPENEFAKNYDNWRRKEELNKLKTKYGDTNLEELELSSSSSSEDDEDGAEWTEEVDKDFFKTLACLKNKDPKIYDANVQFFKDTPNADGGPRKKKDKKEKPMFLKDYERQIILERDGKFSDDDDDEDGGEHSQSKSLTYVEEQKELKEMFKTAANIEGDDSEDETSGMFTSRKVSEGDSKAGNEYKEWLAGRKDSLQDKSAETELKVLKDFWNDPHLNEDEKFLRNYILNQEYLKCDEEDHIPTYDEIVHDSDQDLSEDEKTLTNQELFEHKYNFRFEEPDQDFIKRYPRTMENSVRKKDEKRRLKRAETKDRKQKEKEQKMQDLKQLQELKRKEIEEKIERLRDITGNDEMEFKEEDLDSDFDPEAHDRRMQKLFNDDYYQGPGDEQKPVFPDIDEYLEIENWQNWNGNDGPEGEDEQNTPHCEDEEFNMDCDYDPSTSNEKELKESCKSRKKRKRKSLFAKAVSEKKPVFDPKDKTYQEYLDEYYKLDCEDIIGDIPCKFKYRQVVANDFGLSVEEILSANDRELNKWCSLKKAVQFRPDHVEKYEQIAYQKKAQNFGLKKKIFPSLFSENNDDKWKVESKEEQDNKNVNLGNNKSAERKKKKKQKSSCVNEELIDDGEGINLSKKSKVSKEVNDVEKASTDIKTKNKKKKKSKVIENCVNEKLIDNDFPKKSKVSQEEEKSSTETCVQTKKKHKKKKKEINSAKVESDQLGVKNQNKKKRKRDKGNSVSEMSSDQSGPKRKRSKFDVSSKKNTHKDDKMDLSDARLSAYGINPKKFKNAMKYKNKPNK